MHLAVMLAGPKSRYCALLEPRKKETTMTRKDYELIARAISEVSKLTMNPQASIAVRTVAANIAMHLVSQNDRFDRSKFLKACGVV
jgi:hypothetical protein